MLKKSESLPGKLGEQNTKTSAITPILRALGWNVDDWEEVSSEYKSRAGGNPVDYALCWKGEPKLFVEAKGYGENLDDIKWVEQIISYTSAAGVRWIVLTDGMSWKLYDTSLIVPAENKLFRETTIGEADAAKFFGLITKNSVTTNSIDAVGDTVKVDTAVQKVLEKLFNTGEPNKRLVNLVDDLLNVPYPRNQVRESLGRCQGKFSFQKVSAGGTSSPVPMVSLPLSDSEAGVKQKYYGVKLVDMIGKGFLPVGIVLYPTENKSAHLQAHIVEEGIHFDGQNYPSPSAAGKKARMKADSNAKSNPNGWVFWADGEGKTLFQYREDYLNSAQNET
jgi:hypothetical protein